jgi:hypothetical protein
MQPCGQNELMTDREFNKTLDHWLTALQRYSFEDLINKPSPQSWSMGQLYVHLINETRHYITRINVCISSNRNATKEMAPEGKEMFRNNSFPDERLAGPPSNSRIPQPLSKEALVTEFSDLRKTMNDVIVMMQSTVYHGKAKHPGLQYFNAVEWLQFADMHMRHHLRQKMRIDDFLRLSR